MRLDKKFSAKLRQSPPKRGWTYVIWPDSVKFFGTPRLPGVAPSMITGVCRYESRKRSQLLNFPSF